MVTVLKFLCDADSRFVWLSDFPHPYTSSQVLGQRPWVFLKGNDAVVYEATVARVLTEHIPLTITITVPHIGVWRVTLDPCHLSDVRIVGYAERCPDKILGLTPSQLAICRLISQGHSPKQIAVELGLARGTVDNTRSKIARQIGIGTAALDTWCGEFRKWL